MKETKDIPYGLYCYTIRGEDHKTVVPCTPCPYYESVWDGEAGDSWKGEIPTYVGHCKYLGIKDTLLLNDQCKECGINMPEEGE